MAIQHVDDSSFNSEVTKASKPVLVDFWAEWCGPCKMVAPILEEIAKEYEGKLKIAKVDVEKGPNTASNFGVMSIPTLMLFNNGKVVTQVVGAVSKKEIKSLIDNNI